MRTVSEACLPSPADRPRYFTVGSSEQSGQLLILPPAVRFAKEWGLKDTPQIIQSRIHPREAPLVRHGARLAASSEVVITDTVGFSLSTAAQLLLKSAFKVRSMVTHSLLSHM